jgi:hypothetical protein
VHIDNPTHVGVLVGLGATVALAGALCETLVLGCVDEVVELGPDALGDAACCDPQAIGPAHAIAMTTINRLKRQRISVTYFAGNAVAVAVKAGPVTRLSPVNRRGYSQFPQRLLPRRTNYEARC